jgi:putative membrane protein
MKAINIEKQNNTYYWVIGVLSVVIPVVVAVLFYKTKAGSLGKLDVSFLPRLNAVLNSSVSILLIAGFIFIKRKQQRWHITSMVSAFMLSSLFLISYVIYHYSATGTKFGDLNHDGVVNMAEIAEAGILRHIYFFVLITHIVLATIVVPFVLFSIYFGATKQYEKHKKIVKWTFPIWLYVSITGVLVYLMISPYYTV